MSRILGGLGFHSGLGCDESVGAVMQVPRCRGPSLAVPPAPCARQGGPGAGDGLALAAGCLEHHGGAQGPGFTSPKLSATWAVTHL